MAHQIGRTTAEIEDWMEGTRNSVHNNLWSNQHGRFLDFNLRTGEFINENTIATFIPLFAELASPEQAQHLVRDHLRNPKEYWPHPGVPQFLLPTTSKDNRLWSPVRYWRGPIWVNTNWMVIKGLEAYGYQEEALRIRQDTLRLLRNPMPGAGQWRFWEYFNPLNGSVSGIDNFSWSAALAIELTEISQ